MPHNHGPTDLLDSVRSHHPDILWTAVAVSTAFAMLYGLFLALAVVSLFLLLRRGIRRPLSAIQAFAVTALLMSTTVHWAVVVLQRFGSLLVHPGMSEETFRAGLVVEQCVGTATLTINIILSDLVVWWRAWALWPESRVVHISGCVLLLATFVMSIVDTNFSCQARGGFMFERLFEGTAALSLSLASNFTTTILTAYKAWLCHKIIIRSRSERGSVNTRVQHILALLVESGALYCALWIVVIVWQVGSDSPNWRHERGIASFWTAGAGAVLIEGCLVPLIAIYPTVIIVLVALNKSAVEHGFKRDADSADPAPSGIAVAVETVVSTHSGVDEYPSGRSESMASFGYHGQWLEGSEKVMQMA